MRTILIFIFSLQFSLLTFGQANLNSVEQLVGYTNELYGNDDILVSGKLYIHDNMRSEGHPYYLSNKFGSSIVYIGNKTFFNVLLRYNIEDDEFVLTAKLKTGTQVLVILNNSVDSVFYMGRVFIPAQKLEIPGISKGYYERIVSKNFTFLTKHYKTYDLIHYGAKKYSKLFRAYSISTNSKIVKVNTKKLFISYFSENKKEVQKYLRKNKIDYKTCSREQLTTLIKFCNELQ